jgi:hypothetical protein
MEEERLCISLRLGGLWTVSVEMVCMSLTEFAHSLLIISHTRCDFVVVKLSESFYAVKNPEETKVNEDGLKSVYAVEKLHRGGGVQGIEVTGSKDLALSGYSVFIDADISEEVRRQVSPKHLMSFKRM